jgi:hypothetical protein
MDYNRLEDEVYELINIVRTRPYTFIKDLSGMVPYFNGNKYKAPGMQATLVTSEGVAAVQEAIAFLEDQTPVEVIFRSKGLDLAARDHCFDIGKHSLVSHIGSDGSRMSDRINRYGTWYNTIAENISFSETTAKEIVLNFLIDDGNKTRGHRTTIVNPQLKYIGISCGPHKSLISCCIIDFAGNYEEQGISKKDIYTVKKESSISNDNFRGFDRIKEHDFDKRAQMKNNDDLPPGVTSCRTKKTTTQDGKKKTVYTEKIYTMEDGSTKRVEETEESYE